MDQTETVDKLVLIVVNARSQSANSYGSRASPPGAIDTLMTTISTPIDATSFQMVDQIVDRVSTRLKSKAIIAADFDFIDDARCRDHFHALQQVGGYPTRISTI